MARAIVMRSLGGPEVLQLEDVPRRPLVPGEVRLRTLAEAAGAHLLLASRAIRGRVVLVP